MADKRISQLVERTDIANNDVVPIVASGATTTNKATISSIQEFMQENLDLGVTSVGITLGTTGTDVSVTGSPITTSGNITINIPSASDTARGLVTTGTQTFAGAKTFNSDIIVNGVNVGRGGSSVPSNTRVGNSALQNNTTGAGNTAVGISSLIFTTTGSNNTALGHQVLSNANGSVNTAVGISSLFSLSTGDNNLGIGNQAGSQISSGAGNTISNNSIFIGTDTRPSANNQTNQIVIGHNAIGQGSNTVTIGNSSITSNKLFGRVIHADAVNADESATLGQVNTSLAGYVTLDTAQTITAQKTFSTSGGSDTAIINHGSGSGIALNITKAGNGEGLRVAKTSGTGNAATIIGGLLSTEGITSTAPSTAIGLLLNGRSADNVSIIRFGANTGGGQYNTIQSTPNSLDIGSFGNTPITFGTNLSGGGGTRMTISGAGAVTLTGALNGTSASFTSNIDLIGDLRYQSNAGFGITTQNGSRLVEIYNELFRVNGSLFLTSLLTVTANSGANAIAINGRASDSTGSIDFFQNNGTTRLMEIGVSPSAAEFYYDANSPMIFYTNASPRLTIASTGAATFSSSVTASSSTTGTQTIANFAAANYSSPSSRTYIQIGTQFEDGSSRIGNINTTGNQSALVFQTHAAASDVWNDAMYINGSGLVGIGTASPVTALTIGSRPNTTTFGTPAYGSTVIRSLTLTPTADQRGTLNLECTSRHALDRGALLTFSQNYSTGVDGYEFVGAAMKAGAESASNTSQKTYLSFFTNTSDSSSLTEKMRITSDGFARLSASSGGIQFNGDTAAANALDDYEEGTWTPTIGGTWITNPTSLSGLYTKIGNMVYIRLEFVGGVKASTTSGWIDGLPFSGAVGGGGTVSNVSVQNRGIALLDNNTRVWLTELDFVGLSTKVMASYRL
jgi:hypothetical protein